MANHFRVALYRMLMTLAFFAYSGMGAKPALGGVYTVSPNGSDQNSGTALSPFRTIQKAATVARAGDTVLIKAGTYYERVSIQASGTASQRIVFRGERDAQGNWLTIVDAGQTTKGWVTAPEAGAGVYKTTQIPFESFCLVNGQNKDISRIRSSETPATAFPILSYPATKKVTTWFLKKEVSFWDGIEALYYYNQGTTYLRFRNGDDPSKMGIKASPLGEAFYLKNRSYITLQDLLIRGAQYGVALEGAQATHNIIANNLMINGQARIYMYNGPAYNQVRNNVMHMNKPGKYSPGAWEGTSTPTYEMIVAEHIYDMHKSIIGKGETASRDDAGLYLLNAGSHNEIIGNHIYDTLAAVAYYDNQEGMITISHNVFHNVQYGVLPACDRSGYCPKILLRIHDNLMYNNGMHFRVHSLGQTPDESRYEIFRNRWYNPPASYSTFWHWRSATIAAQRTKHPTIYFYHNSIVGGQVAFTFSDYAMSNQGVPNAHFLNNIISTPMGWLKAGPMGDVANNWVGGMLQGNTRESWLLPSNIVKLGQYFWPPGKMPSFALPPNSDAHQAGIDLSKPFTVGTTKHPALYGMNPGYFSGPAPDLGAVQSGVKCETLGGRCCSGHCSRAHVSASNCAICCLTSTCTPAPPKPEPMPEAIEEAQDASEPPPPEEVYAPEHQAEPHPDTTTSQETTPQDANEVTNPPERVEEAKAPLDTASSEAQNEPYTPEVGLKETPNDKSRKDGCGCHQGQDPTSLVLLLLALLLCRLTTPRTRSNLHAQQTHSRL